MDEDRMARVLAYVDNELSPRDAAAFEAELARDPALAKEVERHRALTAAVGRAYAPVLDEAVPPRLTMVANAANDPGRGWWRSWGAVAASLVVGVIIGRMALPTSDVVQGPGGLVARGALARGLTTQLAADTGPIQVGLTFKDSAGRWCRTFESTPARMAGVACRDDRRWRVELATAVGVSQTPTYRTAASQMSPAILAVVDGLRAGDPLDAEAERRARDGQWR